MEKSIIIDKLVSNALSRHQTVANASLNALKTYSCKNPFQILEYIDNSFQNVQQITPNILDLYCFLFLEVTKQLKQTENQESDDQNKKDINLKIFVSLQFYFIKSKNTDHFQNWEKLCHEFISSSEISKKLYPLVLNQTNLYSTYSFITLFYCAKFVTNDILNSLDTMMTKKPQICVKISTLININPTFFIRLLSKLSEKQQENEEQQDEQENETVSQFLSYQFRFLLQFFLEHPTDENAVKCIEVLFDRIYPSACPAHLRYYVTKICTNLSNFNSDSTASSLSSTQIISIENMLIKFCSIPDSEIWKKTVDFILKHMHIAYIIDMQKHTQQNPLLHLIHFPIDANEMDPSCSSSIVFTSSIENILKLCFSFDQNAQNQSELDMINPLDIILSSLLAGIDTTRASISFKTLSSLLNSSDKTTTAVATTAEIKTTNQVKFSNEQMIMITSSITAVASRNIAEPSLCRLAIDILKLQSDYVSEADATLMTKYIINSSISMNNSHYLLQIVSVNKEFHQVIFDLITDSLFDETKIDLLPSLLQVVHLFLLILTKNEDVSNEIENATDSEDSLQHPLVPVLLKKSVADKSLLLLRMLSCLMSLGAMHPFVPSMISILSIFFDFTFPLAFKEIQSILEAVTKRINTLQPELQIHLSLLNNSDNSNNNSSYNTNSNNRLSEFGSIIMSLLSNIMKLINDSQFRLSLSSAVIHDVEMNTYPLHSQNCLWIFDTIVPFLPFDVSSSNIEKFFKIITFYPVQASNNNDEQTAVINRNISTTLNAFADVLGSISGRNHKLVIQLIKKWKDMKSNNSFLVGKKPQPIPYTFIAMALTSISRDIEVPILLEIANSDLFPLLIQLMKRKNAELNPGYCLSALIELCKRLTFHKVPKTFALFPNNSASNTEFIFKYILNTFLAHKQQKSMLKLCLAAFRYFIQVPPCLTPEQRTIIKDKVINPQFIMFTINEISNNTNGNDANSNSKGDKQLFLELRGLLFAMMCTLPDTATIMTLLVSLMPNCENREVLSLIWRLLSLFDSRREKTKSSNESSPIKSTENNTNDDDTNNNNNASSTQNEDKNNSYNLIKFYKPCQAVKISILPQIIADLLGTFYNKNKSNEKSSNLALQSIYLLFRIDRNISDEVANYSENLTSSLDDSSLVSNISDLSNTVFNKLNQSEIDSLLNYSIDKMKKVKNLSASYGFVISQIMKFVSPKSSLAVVDSHKEQLCIDSINNPNISSNVSLAKMQSVITEFVSTSNTNLMDFVDSNDSLFTSLDLVQQLLLKYPDIFVKKLVQIGFNDSSSKIILKSLEEETGQCVETLLQQLCLFLLEMQEDDKIPTVSSALLFISSIIFNSSDKSDTSNNKKKYNYEIPLIHIYQTISSLLIFGFSMNLFLNTKDIYSTELQNKLKNSVPLLTAASTPIMNNDKPQKQQQRHLFVKVLSLCLSKVPSKSTADSDETDNNKFSILPLDANKAFSISITKLIEGPNILLLIDVVNFLMSACQLNKSKVSSGIAAFCGEVLYHYDGLLLKSETQKIISSSSNDDGEDEEQKPLSILGLFYPTLLSFVINFGEFTCIVSLSEITKFMKRSDIVNPDENEKEFPIHYISRTLQVILKRCSASVNSSSSSLLMTNDVFVTAISCMKQFCKSFVLKLNEEMHSILFNILIELLKACGKLCTNQIASILKELVTTLSKSQELSEQFVKYAVIYEIISIKHEAPSNEKKIKIQINENENEKTEDKNEVNENNEKIMNFDIQKEKNAVISVFEIFLDSQVPLLISSALSLMKESFYNCIIDNFSDKIIELLENPDDNVASLATSVIELSSTFLS